MKMNKGILDLCGGTGAWSIPFQKAGHDVLNVTLPEGEKKYAARRAITPSGFAQAFFRANR